MTNPQQHLYAAHLNPTQQSLCEPRRSALARRVALMAPALGMALFATATAAQGPYPVEWERQFGTTSFDNARDVATDSAGNVYITGFTAESLAGPHLGFQDVYLIKYNATGNQVWATQVGTSIFESPRGIAVDDAGNIYVTGTATGPFTGSWSGMDDMFLIKFDPSGNQVWGVQIGTPNHDRPFAVDVDAAGNAYVAGYTRGILFGSSEDIFLVKYDPSGTQLWGTQFGGGVTDEAYDIAVDDAGNAYVTGFTLVEAANPKKEDDEVHAFVSKHDTNGTQQWFETITSGPEGFESGFGIALDAAGNPYVAGATEGDLAAPNAGGVDAFVAKLDTTGAPMWIAQAGTPQNDFVTGLAVDADGCAFIAGFTPGAFGGPSAGNDDAYLVKFDAAGFQQWVDQPGTDQKDWATCVATDPSGNVFLAGLTAGDLSGPNAGFEDTFLIKYSGNVTNCLPDVNGDGMVTPTDFTAWINAFNNQLPECDQNGDGFCTPTDFTAWIANFNAGC